ncbi:hypothetical protein T02_15368 [Trichinella nativa]|uniref:Uncharacterized protein n=1 Tax=Trichinella nativa TaxID=6335 RepID=A0A0V1LTG9_9BILA|nr:hypothetical protein T02_15368 [Trichinella nativa]
MYIRTVCTNDMNVKFSCYGQSFELLLIKLRLNAPILSILFLIIFLKKKMCCLNLQVSDASNVAGDFLDQVTIVQFRHTVVFFLDSGWRHLVIAVWRFDGSIGQCAGEFFFGRSAGARPDRWSIRRPMVRLTRCWAWRRVDVEEPGGGFFSLFLPLLFLLHGHFPFFLSFVSTSRGRVNLRCLLFDPACQCHSSSSRHSHADPPADLPPTASCRRAFQQYLVKQNRSKQTT